MLKKYALTLDIGGTNSRAAIVADDGTIAARAKEKTGPDPITTSLHLAATLLADAGLPVCGIGIAVAGVVAPTAGIVLRSPNLPAIENLPCAERFTERFDLPAQLVNDANAAALGEKWLGSGKAFDSFVLLTLGTGIGCGVVLAGKTLPIAAEAGHMTIASEGPTCGCGNTGCLEQFASASAIVGRAVGEIERGTLSLLRDLYQGNFYKITAEDVYSAALEGDALARTVLRDAGRALGIGMANLLNIFSPDAIIVTGGLTGAWNIYGEAASSEASRRALPELFRKAQVVVSPVFDDAGMLGAARIVFQNSGTEETKNESC